MSATYKPVTLNCSCWRHTINILLTELSRSVWENLDLGRVYRPHCVRSVLTTSVKILTYRPPARLIRAKYTPVYPCIPLYTPVYPCIPQYTLVYPHIPLYTPVYPCIPLHTLAYPCIPLHTPVYPCIPLYIPVYPWYMWGFNEM